MPDETDKTDETDEADKAYDWAGRRDSPSADDAELAREWLAVQSGRGWRAASGDVVALDSSVEATHSD